MSNYLDTLNPSQREAVVYCDGPQLVIAGAGSGKTRVLTMKIAYLLQHGYNADEIIALTFTKKAATEMKNRIRDLVGPGLSRRLWMGTFTVCSAGYCAVKPQDSGSSRISPSMTRATLAVWSKASSRRWGLMTRPTSPMASRRR